LSYSDKGDLLYTPIVYSGDNAYVATCQRNTGFNAEPILDYSEYLTASFPADEECRKILEQAMEGE